MRSQVSERVVDACCGQFYWVLVCYMCVGSFIWTRTCLSLVICLIKNHKLTHFLTNSQPIKRCGKFVFICAFMMGNFNGICSSLHWMNLI